MPFKDTKEGQTHFENDGCGEPAHNMPKDTIIEEVMKSFDEKWKLYFGDCHCNKSVFEDFLHTALSAQKEEIGREIVEALENEIKSDEFPLYVPSAKHGISWDYHKEWEERAKKLKNRCLSIVSSITSNKEKK